MAKTPDSCLDRIVIISAVLFFVVYPLLVFSYKFFELPYFLVIRWFFVLGLLTMGIILLYWWKYYYLKKANITPIKNRIRDLKELNKLYDVTKDEKIQKEVENCWKKLAEQIDKFLEPKHQYIWVITNKHHGSIGKMEIHDKVNHIYFTMTKDVYLIKSPESTLDLTSVEYIEGIPDLREFYKKHGRLKPVKHWIKLLREKL